MSRSSEVESAPRAIIHKKILDTAEEHPDDSIEELASKIPGATTSVVERVLEEHGDPADTDGEATGSTTATAETTGSETQPDSDGNSPTGVSFEELSAKQREVLLAIRKRPEASQRDLAKQLDVSAATISNRVNSIPGFQWNRRTRFLDRLPGIEYPQTDSASAMTSNDDTGTGEQSDRSDRRQEETHRIEPLQPGRESGLHITDPEVALKVLHLCLESDTVSEDEELTIMKSLME